MIEKMIGTYCWANQFKVSILLKFWDSFYIISFVGCSLISLPISSPSSKFFLTSSSWLPFKNSSPPLLAISSGFTSLSSPFSYCSSNVGPLSSSPSSSSSPIWLKALNVFAQRIKIYPLSSQYVSFAYTSNFWSRGTIGSIDVFERLDKTVMHLVQVTGEVHISPYAAFSK